VQNFNAVLGRGRGGVGEQRPDPVVAADTESGLESEPDLGFVERLLSPALEAAWEAGDHLCYQNYSTERTLDELRSRPGRHVYVDARYTQDGELVAVSSYEEYGLSFEDKLPYRVLYRGKDVAALAAKLAAVGKQLENDPDEPFSLTEEPRRRTGDPAPAALNRKVVRIASDRKRAAKLLA
jgi:hypothetical protein